MIVFNHLDAVVNFKIRLVLAFSDRLVFAWFLALSEIHLFVNLEVLKLWDLLSLLEQSVRIRRNFNRKVFYFWDACLDILSYFITVPVALWLILACLPLRGWFDVFIFVVEPSKISLCFEFIPVGSVTLMDGNLTWLLIGNLAWMMRWVKHQLFIGVWILVSYFLRAWFMTRNVPDALILADMISNSLTWVLTASN